MAITVKHKFVSAIPDAGDTTIVQPSNWNDDHQLSGTVPVANGGTGASTLTGYVKGNGTSAMTAATTVPNTDVTGLGTASTKDAGVANGVATLDSSGQVPLSQIPPLGDLNYQGTWNATTNSPTLTSSVGTKGFYYVVSVAGTTNLNGITDWQIGDWAVFNGSVWQKIDNTDAVTSVNGYTGTVVLNAADVGAVPYTGATGAVDLNAKTLVNVSNLGVNTTTVPTIKIRAVGDNNSSSRIAMRGYSSDANSSAIRVSKFRGTVAAPQAPISGDSLGKFELAGYGTTSADAYPQVSLEGVTTEVWGATARGAKAVVKVTPNTTITQVTALTIDQDSKATFANTVTANGVLLTGNTGTVTSVAATAGTGISVSGSPITTSGTLTITNTAPDQTVALTAGTGISTSGTYPNFTITNTAPSSGGTVTSVTGTAPVVSSGGNTPAISMAAANTTTNGYLTSTDWNTFNGKSNTNGTVTSVAALTLGTTGTDLSSTVANGTTTPVITLQVPTASATNRGALSSTDWSTFNSKAPAVTYTTGYVPFGQGTTTLNQESVFFWDTTNKRLGLGTSSPAQTLHAFKGSSGATAPTNIAGVFENSAASGIALLSPDANASRIYFGTPSNNANVALYGQYNYGFDVYLAGTLVLHADTSTGNVGVGNTSTIPSKFAVYSASGGSTTGLSVVASGNMLNVFGSSSTNAGVILDATNGTVGSATGVPMIFRQGGVEAARISTSGGVSIGNTTDAGASNLSVTGIITQATTLAAYVWANWNPTNNTGTSTVPSTGNNYDSTFASTTISSGTTTTTFNKAGKYLVSIMNGFTAGAAYTYSRRIMNLGGTATRYLNLNGPSANGDATISSNYNVSTEFYVVATAGQTITIQPTLELNSISSVTLFSGVASATFLYCGV